MKTYLLLLCTILLWACEKTSQPQGLRLAEQEKFFSHEQDELLREAISPMPENTQIAIALIKDGEVGFIGVKRIDTTSFYQLNSKLVFEIGSISKVFTASLLADFVDQGQIKL